jgi:hypothetical protein
MRQLIAALLLLSACATVAPGGAAPAARRSWDPLAHALSQCNPLVGDHGVGCALLVATAAAVSVAVSELESMDAGNPPHAAPLACHPGCGGGTQSTLSISRTSSLH